MIKNDLDNFWVKKTVLVTGGTGFIGSYFVQTLSKMGVFVICLARKIDKPTDFPPSNVLFKEVDLLRFDDLLKIDNQIDVIINCAAMDGNTIFKIGHQTQIMDTNIKITSNILNLAKNKNIKDVVLMSSAEIYSTQTNPIKEEDDYKVDDKQIVNGYILSKKYSDILGELYKYKYNINIFLPRPTNVYGPGDHFIDELVRVIPSMINRIFSRQSVEIWGNGSQIRQFLYVEDLVQAVLTMVSVNKYHKMNIAGNEAISILELAKLIYKIIGTKENIKLVKSKPIGVNERILDTRKLNSIINFKPTPLSRGIKSTVDWYKEKYLTD